MDWLVRSPQDRTEHLPSVDADAWIEALQIFNEIVAPGITIEGEKGVVCQAALHKMALRIDSYAKGRRPA